MSLKDQVNQNAVASQQATCTPSDCKVCKRQGIPIFPLRVAAVPNSLVNKSWRPPVPKQEVDLTSGEFKYALRTLREGYLYVLLFNKSGGGSVWQSYEVTADGCMRLYNPQELPEAEAVALLAESCRMANHDVIASFINIDNTLYNEAWLAFSSDPWSQDVLDDYKARTRPISRFTKILISESGLVSIKPEKPPEKPAGDYCIALDYSLSALKSSVAEFATDLFPNIVQVGDDKFGGKHGFYSRTTQQKQNALSSQISQLEQQYNCKVMAVPVADKVGIVQELNNGRMQLIEMTQPYIEQPGILHKHIISEAITQYLKKMKEDIATEVGHLPPVISTGPSVGGDGPVTREIMIEQTFAEKYARLLKSYDEPARAAFEQQFKDNFILPQERIKAIDKDLAAWYRVDRWLDVLTYDYAPEVCAAGWAAQMKTIATCVQGGATSKETEDIWLAWLMKPDSPAYLGFTGMNTSLLAAVFSGANVFGDLKTAATIDEFANFLKRTAIRRSWASRILAASGSVSRLGKAVDPATRKGYLAMTQAAMLTAGESTVIVEKNTTLRKLKRELKNNAALRQALEKNNATFELNNARGGGAVLVDELMGMRGKALDIPVKVQYSLRGALKEIKDKLPTIDVTKAPFNNPAVLDDISELFISDLSLQGKGVTGPIVKASYAQVAAWNERGMRLISGDSAGLIMGAGLMALQVANWADLIERLHTSVGADVDVLADISINNLLYIEGFSELSGFASKLAVKQNWVVLGEAEQVPGPVRFGAVLGGLAAIVDGIRNGIHGWEVYKAGDSVAGTAYASAGISMFAGGTIAAIWGRRGIFAFTSSTGLLGLGPVGWATILIIVGIMLSYTANDLRTTAFETWLRRTCFGIRDPEFKGVVWSASSQRDLAEAVVEYRAIRSGMVADVDFSSDWDIFTGNPTIESVEYRRVDFRVGIPGWDKRCGGWSVNLTGGDKLLFSCSVNAPGYDDALTLNGPEGYGKYSWFVEGEEDENGQLKGPQALIIAVSVWGAKSRTPGVTLVAEYWPDKAEPEYKLGLTLSAEQD